MKKECEHKWVEDEMFACGAIMMVGGSIDDLGEETRIECTECGAVDYVPKNVFKRINLLK
jgi:hypothetical protein